MFWVVYQVYRGSLLGGLLEGPLICGNGDGLGRDR